MVPFAHFNKPLYFDLFFCAQRMKNRKYIEIFIYFYDNLTVLNVKIAFFFNSKLFTTLW